MPLTVPTHPIAVLPLKLRWPRHIDGVAVVLGCIAPDVAYAADGYGVTIHSHAWHAPLWWALPVTVLGTLLVRWAAPVVAAHLPRGGTLALRDYGALGTVRHGYRVTVTSVLLGAASHIVWDAFTHPIVDGGHVPMPALHHEPLPDAPVWWLLSVASDVVGIGVAAALVTVIGRRRLLLAWHGPAPVVAPRPVRFWSAAAVVSLAGAAALPAQPVRLFHDQAVRCLLIAGAALLAGAAAARWRSGPSVAAATPTAAAAVAAAAEVAPAAVATGAGAPTAVAVTAVSGPADGTVAVATPPPPRLPLHQPGVDGHE